MPLNFVLFLVALLAINSDSSASLFDERLQHLQEVGRSTAALSDDVVESLFDKFVVLFERRYSLGEYTKRLAVFKRSIERHIKLNKKETLLNGTATYGINQFSDWTPQEFRETLLRPNINSTAKYMPSSDGCTLHMQKYPESADWKQKITRIKNQKSCGSCWAFVASEQVESYWAIAGNTLTEYSPQELLSCSPSRGCEGGNTCTALKWLAQTQNEMMKEVDYPYEEEKTKCRYTNRTHTGVKVKAVCGCQSLVGYEYVMAHALFQKGPLGVNVDAVSWHDYIGGVIQHHCSNQNMNHAVQLVGYHMNDGPVPYWTARNQWGPTFGEGGFVRLKYGENICGVAEQPSFVVV